MKQCYSLSQCAIWILIAIMLLLPVNSFAQSKNKQELSLTDDEIKTLFEKKKDPVFSGILSFYMPGLGQFYCDEKLKGAAFLITEYTIIIGSFFYFLDFNFKAGGDSGFNLKVDANQTDMGLFSIERKHLFYATVATLSLIHIFNIIDAVKSAYLFNSTLEQKRKNLIQKYPHLDMGCNNDGGMYLAFSSHL